MLCEKCHKKKATVKINEVKNNKKFEYNLCEDCAKEYFYIQNPHFNKSPEFIKYLFLIKKEEDLEKEFEEEKEENILKCKMCGMTLKEFRSTGRLGCPNDYEVFKEDLKNMLKDFHGKDTHIGKIPKRYKKNKKYEEELSKLKEMLDEAVAKELYEKAAEIRDKIKELEKKYIGE